jgi:predicted nucleic acid-binding protein
MQYLIDTGVLLRLFDRADPAHPDIRAALQLLRQQGHALVACAQNVAEFWSVSTRPSSARGGYGQSVSTTERRVQFFERCGDILPETAAAYQAWRRILVHHAIQGVAVHDARLVATMETAGITHIVTLNAKDFARFPGVVVVSLQDLAASIKPSS